MINIKWNPMKEESPYSKWGVSVVRDGEVVWDSGVIESQEPRFVRLPDCLVRSKTVRFTGKRLDVGDDHE